jgi:protein FAM32A
VSEYAQVLGGKLKLKGQKTTSVVLSPLKKEKKHKKKHHHRETSHSRDKNASEGENLHSSKKVGSNHGVEGDHRVPAVTEMGEFPPTKVIKTSKGEIWIAANADSALDISRTKAEIAFENHRQKIGSLHPETVKSHKEKIDEFNNKLSQLTEHHDLPKVGPG